MPRKAQPPTDTKFMVGIKEKLIANDLAEGTAKLYITKLKKLNKNQQPKIILKILNFLTECL